MAVTNVSSDDVLRACCFRIYRHLWDCNLQPGREDLVRDDECTAELIASIKQVWIEEAGGKPNEWPWNSCYVKKMYIACRKATRDGKEEWSVPNGESMFSENLFPPNTGWVYFIRNSERNIKIGWTEKTPEERVAALHTSDPTLKIDAAIRGFKSLEGAMHFRFAQFRIWRRREWFYSHPELEELIDKNRNWNHQKGLLS